MAMLLRISVLLAFHLLNGIYAYPEEGLHRAKLNGSTPLVVSQSVVNDSKIAILVSCDEEEPIIVHYEIYCSQCLGKLAFNSSYSAASLVAFDPGVIVDDAAYPASTLMYFSGQQTVTCTLGSPQVISGENGILKPYWRKPSNKPKTEVKDTKPGAAADAKPDKGKGTGTGAQPAAGAPATEGTRRKRDAAGTPKEDKVKADKAKEDKAKEDKAKEDKAKKDKAKEDKAKPTGTDAATTPAPVKKVTISEPKYTWKSWRSGFYFIVLTVQSAKPDTVLKPVTVEVRVTKDKSFLSLMDYTYFHFYIAMVVMYVLLNVAWLIMLARNWRDVLRVQYFIEFVCILGLLEKALFLSLYEKLGKDGTVDAPTLVVAHGVYCFKRAVARTLIIVVSMGYGIVKPRLGATQVKVLAVGVVYFLLAAVEDYLHTSRDRGSTDDKDDLIANIPLALCETFIFWWALTSLWYTIKTLKLRRNIVKLSVYRHFTNVLVLSVIASIIFVIWDMKTHRFADCAQGMGDIWLEEGFWQILFCLILIGVMFLFRPSTNNKMYAFVPILDGPIDDEEEDEIPLTGGGQDNLKSRRSNKGHTVNNSRHQGGSRVEEDLKWIEENLPATMADTALGALAGDSDEELNTARAELSKMD